MIWSGHEGNIVAPQTVHAGVCGDAADHKQRIAVGSEFQFNIEATEIVRILDPDEQTGSVVGTSKILRDAGVPGGHGKVG
jgi:hypothetical protein